jgi:multimeric flavodoxin WrbA
MEQPLFYVQMEFTTQDKQEETMKVIGINGSPRKTGNTSLLMDTVFQELEAQGIETETIHIGREPVRGCIGCFRCMMNKDGVCAVGNDPLNEWLGRMREADGILLGSPVYTADVAGTMKCFMDRASMVSSVSDDLLKHKVGAGVVALRRAGSLHALNSFNNFFTILQMVVVGSSYWNMGYGLEEGGVRRDEEGLNTMKNLGRNMAWVIKSLKAAGIEPPLTTQVEEYKSFAG